MFAAKKSNRNAWVGLHNINYCEENKTSIITERTKELIGLKQLDVETSLTDTTLLTWDYLQFLWFFYDENRWALS